MNLDLLKRLCETPGIPGREERVRALIETEAKLLFDEIATDPMGSLVCTRKGKGKNPEKIMLACHMDEIGFIVSHVTELKSRVADRIEIVVKDDRTSTLRVTA